MASEGQTFVIDCSQGGFNASKNIESIAPELMVVPTKNLKLGEGLRETRDGSDIVNSLNMTQEGTAWVEVAPKLDSEANIRSLIVFNSALYGGTKPNGKLYKWNGSNLWVLVAGKLGSVTDIYRMAVFKERLYAATNTGQLYRLNSGGTAWEEAAPAPAGITQINSIIEFNGSLYAGGQDGKLYRWNNTDTLVEVASNPAGETNVGSLVIFNSQLYGILTTNGKLHRFNGTDAWIEVTSVGLGTPISTTRSIVFDGTLYVSVTLGGGISTFDGISAWVTTNQLPMLQGHFVIFNSNLYIIRLSYGVHKLANSLWPEVIPGQDSIDPVVVFNGKVYGGGLTTGKLYEFGQPTKITGIYDATFQNLQQSVINSDSEGKIWKDQTSILKTGLAKNRFTSFAFLNNTLFMTNGANVPQTWDGLATETVNLGLGGVSAPGVISFDGLNRVTTATGLAIGSTLPNVANGAFTFYLEDSSYSQDADAVGVALSGSDIPKNRYGAWRLEVGGDATVDIIAATDNANGYDDADEAIAGLPMLSSVHASMGTVTVSKSDAVFVPGTTNLDDVSTMVVYTDGGLSGNVEDGTHSYKVTFLDSSGETTGGATSDVITIRAKAFDGQVSLLTIPLGGALVSQRKLYRTETGDTGDYKLLTILSDNITTIYTDNTADADLGAVIPTINTTSTSAADWSVNNDAPTQFFVHSRGNSRRLVAIGAAGTPTTIYLSASNNGNDFVTGVVTLIIDTDDGYGIVGGVSFIGRLILFGRKQSFIVNDSSSTTSDWGYGSTAWQGGAINWRCIVETDTDVHVMADDGEIYSITGAQEFGDYKRASLTVGSFIHNWVKNNVKLEASEKFHGVYDPIERAVNWFVVRKGQVDVDTCLVFYLDRPINYAWMIRDNQDNPSGYNAQCSTIVRYNKKHPTVFTGDGSGYIWKLNQVEAKDNSLAYNSKFKTPVLTFGLPNSKKKYLRGRILAIPYGINTTTVDIWVDGIKQTSQTVTLGGSGDVYGTGVYGTVVYGSVSTIDVTFPIKAIGKRIQLEISNSTNGGRFKIMQLMIDFVPLGVVIE